MRSRHLATLFVAPLALAAVLASCGSDATQPPAATVDGETIAVSEVNDALERFEESPQFDQLAQQSDERSARRQFEQAYLSQQVRRAVIRPAAEELGIEVGANEIEAELERIRSQFESEEQFEEALEGQGLSQRELDDLVRDGLLEQKVRSEMTTQEDLRSFYDSNEERFKETRAQHILVQDNGLALVISDQLMRAPDARVDQLFARLARKHSTDPSKSEGGSLGWVTPGALTPPFEEAMDDLGVGEVSKPVRTDFGTHVIRVTGRRTKSFGDVTEEIRAQVGAEAFQEWVTAAFEDADVDINPRYGELDPETGRIVNATAEDVPGADDSSNEERPAG
jgi:foldase protein PrsA